MNAVFYALVAVVAATISWLAAKIRYAKPVAVPNDYEEIKGQLQQLKITANAQQTLCEEARKNHTAAVSHAQHLQTQLTEESKKLATALAEYRAANKQLTEANETRQQALTDVTGQREELQRAKQEIAGLKAENKACIEKLEAQKAFVEDAKATMEREFRLIANTTLQSNAERLSQDQKEKLSLTLQPLQDQIAAFSRSVEEKFLGESRDKSALQKEVELLRDSSLILQKQASDLAEALRGSTKQQGDWGEGLLERILEHCGLQEGIHYTVQASEKAADGSQYRPDVVVHMTEGRNLVIDSKVTLNAWWDMCGCEDAKAREGYLPQICKALKTHIDELCRRPYNEVKGTPGYLVMFIPVEAAYIAALQHESGLWKYAYDKNVLLISPTNLIPFMRMIEGLWDRERKYKNSLDIATKAGALYDKLAGFAANYEKVGESLDKARKLYNDSYAQLATGRGNAIAKAEEMKALSGAKSALPQKIVGDALLAEHMTLPTADGASVSIE